MPGLSGIFHKSKRARNKSTITSKAKGAYNKIYLKAAPLRELSDLDNIKDEVNSGNILILRITPLANRSIEDVKRAVNELCEFADSINGDIARLGEERVVICPSDVRIWREKASIPSKPIPTAA